MEENVKDIGSKMLRSVWALIKRNVVLILCVIIAFAGVGVGYAYMQKPNYVASVKVRYMLTGTANGQGVGTYEDVTTMMAFVDTAIDFVDEGVVLDRASYYYKCWMDVKGTGKTLREFLEESSKLNYDPASKVDPMYNFSKSNISIATTRIDNQTQFFFSIKYKAITEEKAVEMTQILARAYKEEILLKDQKDDFIYFDGLEIDIDEKGVESVVSDVSKKKTVLLAFVIGVIVAAVVVFVKDRMDVTVRDRNELEEITDLKVVALLDI